MSLILNILWFICGGFMAIGWFLAGIIMAITIIGLPWAKACFVMGQFALWPFGREAMPRDKLTGEEDIGTGVLGLLGNIIWFVFGGVWLAIAHLSAALTCFVTIIGIPFGVQHIKLAMLSLAPIGKTIVLK
ncbi:YccF domain-containing protein [Kingella kingae]|uniref:YccF domain-containing protein n=1 Tax=Kingella kingae TaxID=504 RepID=UPI00254D4E9B|nr:YccF domain-containing protein [Kingella kingae]MDK4649743.1 YccF domain-containing protein [Kingella kingae]